MQYLENHFLKYVQGDSEQHKLIAYDRHKSHVNPQVAEWACEHKMILLVLSPPPPPPPPIAHMFYNHWMYPALVHSRTFIIKKPKNSCLKTGAKAFRNVMWPK